MLLLFLLHLLLGNIENLPILDGGPNVSVEVHHASSHDGEERYELHAQLLALIVPRLSSET